jgi:CubicO group peptidase (beta-lactamase class C family)
VGALAWSVFDDVDASQPGVFVLVRESSEHESWRSMGAEWPGGPPLDANSVLYVSSIAKQFTAACIGLLVLDKTVSLDDDVRVWIPELREYPSVVRVHHLLAHTSGLPDANVVDHNAGFDVEGTFTTDDRVAVIADLELEHEPGSVHRYNGLGYVLLAKVVERATGSCLGAFAHERIFGPLAMASSAFRDYSRPEVVPGWHEGQRRVEITTTCVGDGGLVTCGRDLSRWDEWLPGSDLAQLMLRTRPHLPDGSWAHDAWGISIRTHHGHRIESHGGNVQGHLASFIRFADLRVSIIALANTDAIDRWGERLGTLVDEVLGDTLDRELPPWSETHGIPVESGTINNK